MPITYFRVYFYQESCNELEQAITTTHGLCWDPFPIALSYEYFIALLDLSSQHSSSKSLSVNLSKSSENEITLFK